MSRYLVKHDGLFLGSSSACNLVACVKLAKQEGWTKGQTVVTILYDFLKFFHVISTLTGCIGVILGHGIIQRSVVKLL